MEDTSVQLDDVHRGHGETRTVDQAADVSVELDVVEVVLGGRHFSGILLALVLEGEDVLLSELSIVVEAKLGVQSHDCAEMTVMIKRSC